MKICVFFALSIQLFSINIFANSQMTITIGHHEKEVLMYKKVNKNKKEMYILSYKSPKNGFFNQAITKKMYSEFTSKFETIKKNLIDQSRITPICAEVVQVVLNEKLSLICLDHVSLESKKRLIVWFNEQSSLAMNK